MNILSFAHTRIGAFLHKVVASISATAMIATLAPALAISIAVAPNTAEAFSYTLTVTSATLSGSVLTVTGTASAEYNGNINAQYLGVDWNVDGTPDESVLIQDIPGATYTTSNPKTYNVPSWTLTHDYGIPGDYTAIVKLFHST